ncbi:ACT domain-containing protein ACR8-like [Musa acuminata AAA Group]|uniref:ACT domain-containing protein ACR n=1 Tax=Musa acuminata subsp. malaccensis TaxID=214687 RepID=A0A804HZF0_MUSAM|nr:PREDICTED: ACT domain-containing protein ACR8-like [Musa acuminata subsp. malaccensis]CAG1861138.1 unnamed protein product [Musa acuminata subsp. malaccensis]
MEWPSCLNEYEKLIIRMDTPRVVIDNAVCPTATLVKVDSARKHGILLEAVQVLTDLNLSIKKAYISSDGRWFMDVFHVTDQFGRKLADDSVISYLEQSLDMKEHDFHRPDSAEGLTVLELTGADRPGLLSEVFAVLADLCCGVVDAKVWTHNGRIACLVTVKDKLSGCPIDGDPQQLHHVESRLRHVLKGDNGVCGARTAVTSIPVAHTDRRLHQMMFSDRDYERHSPSAASSTSPAVSVQNWVEKGYSVVAVQCRDRPKLLFDVMCTLTDMEYVVFHGTIDTDGDVAHQEFYIRHKDGSPISSEAERQRMIQCLQAAIERRATEGIRLELCIEDRAGLFSEVTRTFRENGLLVTRAEVSTKGDTASGVFYVTSDAAGQPADPKAVDAVRQRIGADYLTVKEEKRPQYRSKAGDDGDEEAQGSGGVGIGLFYLGNLFWRNLYNLGLIKSCS